MEWALFFQIILLMLVSWMILAGLISTYYTHRAVANTFEKPENRSDETIISS